MHVKRFLLLSVGAPLVATCALLLSAQNVNAPTKHSELLKKQRIEYTSPASGEQMYRQYCAVCHGNDGGGRGRAILYLNAAPANLRMLSKMNHGKYPAHKVHATVIGGVAHGSADMPAWGPLFRQPNGLREPFGVSEMRATNLTRYVETMQEK